MEQKHVTFYPLSLTPKQSHSPGIFRLLVLSNITARNPLCQALDFQLEKMLGNERPC